MSIHRRSLLTGAATAVALAHFQPSKDCRVAIAGAIADPGDAGRAVAKQKSGAKEKPGIVTISSPLAPPARGNGCRDLPVADARRQGRVPAPQFETVEVMA